MNEEYRAEESQITHYFLNEKTFYITPLAILSFFKRERSKTKIYLRHGSNKTILFWSINDKQRGLESFRSQQRIIYSLQKNLRINYILYKQN